MTSIYKFLNKSSIQLSIDSDRVTGGGGLEHFFRETTGVYIDLIFDQEIKSRLLTKETCLSS